MACFQVKNPNHHCAICTLWFVPPETDQDYNIIGYCRTKPGILLMAKTLLSMPQITDLIIITDSPRGMLEDVLRINEVMKRLSRSNTDAMIRVHQQSWDDLNTSLEKSERLHDMIDVSLPKTEERVCNWPRRNGYVYHANTVKRLYHYAMNLIYLRGSDDTLRDLPIKQIICLTLNLRDQSSSSIYGLIRGLYSLSVLDDYLERYNINSYLNSHTKKSIESGNQAYEYLPRLISNGLLTTPLNNTKSWIPIFNHDDTTSNEKPCCVGIQLVLQQPLIDKQLDMTIVFRSHDIKNAWLLNIMGFRFLQEQLCKKHEVRIGTITSVSINAHYYKGSFDDIQSHFDISVENFVDDDYTSYDGYYVVSYVDNKISVEYFDNNADLLKRYTSELEDYESLIETVASSISSSSHAAYVSKEVMKIYFLNRSETSCSL